MNKIYKTRETLPTKLGAHVHLMVLMISGTLGTVNAKLVIAFAYVKSLTKTKIKIKTNTKLFSFTKTKNNCKSYQN